MNTKTLKLPPGALEHPLFRAGMQFVVGVRQQHPREMLLRYADHLEAMLVEYVDFRPCYGHDENTNSSS